MDMFERYLDRNINVQAIATSTNGTLEQAPRAPQDRRPIPLCVNALRELRKDSLAISRHGDEIRFSHTAHARLGAVATELDLGAGHYHYRRQLGYGVVIGRSDSTEPATVLAEGLRVCAPGGVVLYPLSDLEASQDLSGDWQRLPDIRLTAQDFAVLQKA